MLKNVCKGTEMTHSSKRPAWVSPVIHAGMVMTIGSVLVAQFISNETIVAVLVGIAIFGIILSMPPILLQTSNLRLLGNTTTDGTLLDETCDPSQDRDTCDDDGAPEDS